MADLREMILSEDYADYILPAYPGFLEDYRDYGPQFLTPYIGTIHGLLTSDDIRDYYRSGLYYSTIPKLFSLLDTVSLDASGITTVQNQPVLNLKGNNVLIGFIDTGIDYTHPAFRFSDGRSRIYGIWDQTVQSGTPPFDLPYGSEYTQEDLNAALASDNPLELVPSTDEVGHGTFLAGIAAGSSIPENDFVGAAPGSTLVAVKLKGAKQYLKELFYHTGSQPVFQETDIMMGLSYLLQIARKLSRPIVICLGLGSNQGAHTGQTYLSRYLSQIGNYWGVYTIAAAGNEAGKAHHFYNAAPLSEDFIPVEVLVREGTQGFTMELWGNPPEIYSIGFESPLGEVIQRLPPRINFYENVNFILENTQILVVSDIIQTISGDQLIFMRFTNPTPGSWKIRVYASGQNAGGFHIWLPVSGFNEPDVTFLRPSPDTTITTPAVSVDVLTTAGYNAYNNSLFINSSRGFTRNNDIKPDITSPGVDVYGPAPGGRFVTMTGTSASAAITAGAAALVVEWGIERIPPKLFNNHELKSLFIRGADRNADRIYPNREWGYGTLNVYQIFTAFTSI